MRHVWKYSPTFARKKKGKKKKRDERGKIKEQSGKKIKGSMN